VKVLIVGGGGREHAIAWKLKQDDPSIELIAAPGNPGIAGLARCVGISATDIAALAELAEAESVELTVVGPEAPLEMGIADLFQKRGLNVLGPTAAAARIESSKRFAKELMTRAGVPTARAEIHGDSAGAKRAASSFGSPVVIKASGLAAGKGVIVAQSSAEAERAIDSILNDRVFGDAGSEILVEEFMEGEEISLFAISDGERFHPLLAAQDHKRLLDGDLGPNTGGMGAYAPTALATPALLAEISALVLAPTLAALRERGAPFTGLLYAGLMLTSDGPKVVEFNCRFGDPETQTILPLMKSSLLELLSAVANGDSVLNANPVEWTGACSVTTVLAARGYPEPPRLGDPIRLPAPPNGIHVFHAGTKRDAETGELVTAGGRVLAVTGIAPTMEEAAACSRAYAERVTFDGKQMRRDIGYRELERHAGAS